MKKELLTLFGVHSILIRMRIAPHSIRKIFVENTRCEEKKFKQLVHAAHTLRCAISIVNANQIRTIAFSKNDPRGAIAIVEPLHLCQSLNDILSKKEKNFIFLILDSITDPNNLGACLRSAAVFDIDAVITQKRRSSSLTEAVHHVSCGASQIVPLISVVNLSRTLKELRKHGVLVIAAENNDSLNSIYDIDARNSIAWVMGSESNGIRRLVKENCDMSAKIDSFGYLDTLNVSVASSICLYETRRQRLCLKT